MTRASGTAGSRLTLTPVSCADCALGAYAASTSQFCPFIIRRVPAGTELFSAANPAPDYLWLVMDGVVGLCHADQPQRVAELRLPGSLVGARATAQRVASARVLTQAMLCGATRSAYERWMDEVRASERSAAAADPDSQTTPLRPGVRNVTCPNSAHLETIAYTERDDGTIARIDACTAFGEDSAVSCDQLCASRLNQRQRLGQNPPCPHATQIGVAPSGTRAPTAKRDAGT